MHDTQSPDVTPNDLRDDFIPSAHYTSTEFAARERVKLWPRVWQMACRMEEVANVGSFATYEILDESVVIVRSASDQLKAFHNVCPHRGNRIAHGQGNVTKLTCRFHGWQWSLNGAIERVKEREDWAGCPMMGDQDLSLKEIRIAVWGGFVFINFDSNPEPFEQFIDPLPRFLDCMEFEKMSFIWYKTMKIAANWKTTLESFMESYHVSITHPQTVPFLDSLSVSYVHGKHGRHGYPNARPAGAPSPASGRPMPEDLRQGYVQMFEAFADQIGGAVTSYRTAKAIRRILEETPANVSVAELNQAGYRIIREAAQAEGADIAAPTADQAASLGVDWSVFPNMVLVFGLDCTLVFRARPENDDPNRCLFDMWGLLRQAPGKLDPVEREYYADWRENQRKIPHLLVQDLTNIETIQRGMRSSAFVGSRTNPVQERQISNNHRQILRYFAAGAEEFKNDY